MNISSSFRNASTDSEPTGGQSARVTGGYCKDTEAVGPKSEGDMPADDGAGPVGPSSNVYNKLTQKLTGAQFYMPSDDRAGRGTPRSNGVLSAFKTGMLSRLRVR